MKRDLMVDKVADSKDLRATEDELDGRIEEIAKKRGVEPGKVYAGLQKENRLKELERSITEDKVFAFLIEQSTVTES